MTISTGPISFKKRHWVLPGADSSETDAQLIAELARELHVPTLVARLLAGRGLKDPADANAFLTPEFKRLIPPEHLPNIGAAVERLTRALSAGEKIILFGDYDVDGITGTTILWRLLKSAGARVDWYIPHRVSEGYGMTSGAVNQLIDDGAQLIVSIDCGIACAEAIGAAVARGVDVIVTDHHEIPEELPPAVAIVHPRLTGSTYVNGDLCGAGVAYKLAWALATRLCGGERVSQTYKDILIESSALVALATIADVVPLLGENRILVKFGLRQLTRSQIPGLHALREAAGYTDRAVDCTAVGFGLAPRLNAAGRMGHAREAAELLMTDDLQRAEELASELEAHNKQRQATERRMFETAQAEVDSWPGLPSVIVVESENYHAGVVGIVASRLVERYGRPAFVLALSESEAHGSARSIECFALHEAIEHCREHLSGGGGHAMAAGVRLPRGNVEIFRDAINAFAAARLKEEDFVPALRVDGVLDLADVDMPAIQRLEDFAPFGRGNSTPRFLVEKACLTAPPRQVGASGAHLQLTFQQHGRYGRGIAFKMGAAAGALRAGMELDLVVEARVETYAGRTGISYIVADMARSDGGSF